MTLLVKGYGMLRVVTSPVQLNTTTWALRLNPPAASLISNKQFVTSFVMGFRDAAQCRTALLDAVSCCAQVLGGMTTKQRGQQRAATSPHVPAFGLQGKDRVQETHICVLKALQANCSW